MKSAWIIMDQSRQYVIKGKGEKYLAHVNEPTKKHLVFYQTENTAHHAIRRLAVYLGPAARQAYRQEDVKRYLIPVLFDEAAGYLLPNNDCLNGVIRKSYDTRSEKP